MDNLQSLRALAKRLQTDGPYWRSFVPEALMGWLYDGEECVYCGVNLVGNGDTVIASTDHLLPNSKYERLRKDPLNFVPACIVCNSLKHNWDPNTDGGEPLLTDNEPSLSADQRRILIGRASDHIKAKREARMRAFQKRDLESWRQAMVERRAMPGLPEVRVKVELP